MRGGARADARAAIALGGKVAAVTAECSGAGAAAQLSSALQLDARVCCSWTSFLRPSGHSTAESTHPRTSSQLLPHSSLLTPLSIATQCSQSAYHSPSANSGAPEWMRVRRYQSCVPYIALLCRPHASIPCCTLLGQLTPSIIARLTPSHSTFSQCRPPHPHSPPFPTRWRRCGPTSALTSPSPTPGVASSCCSSRRCCSRMKPPSSPPCRPTSASRPSRPRATRWWCWRRRWSGRRRS